MVDKVVLNTVPEAYDATALNSNFDAIKRELNEKVLYRDNPSGTANQVHTDIDMNSCRLFNLPAPTNDNEAARLQDVKNVIAGLGDFVASCLWSVFDYSGLRAYTGSNLCVYVQKDGISGVFVYDSTDTASIDNGGTVIVAVDGKRWKREFAGPVHLSWFEARGNGDTSDVPYNNVAIQSALNALKIGQTLYVNPGNYYYDVKLTCATNGIHIVADADNGTYCSALVFLGTAEKMLSLSGNEVGIAGVSFIGSANLLVMGAGATNIGVELTGDEAGNIDGTVRNCSFSSLNCGIETYGRNVNIYDNIFGNSKNGVRINPVASGACRDFIIQRNRFHHMGDLPNLTYCIFLPAAANAFEAQIRDNFYDGQAHAMFVCGKCDECVIAGNRISLPKCKWIDLQGNIVQISDNVFEGNSIGASGSGISIGPGSDVVVCDNILVNAPYHGIVISGVTRFKISDNSISNASNMASASYDAIVVDDTCSYGKINDNHVVNTSPNYARHGLSGEPSNTTAYGNEFVNCASGNVGSAAVYNIHATAYGHNIEGANGVMQCVGAKYKSLDKSETVDVAYVDFDSDYGACILEMNVSLYGASGAPVYASLKRYITFVSGVPAFNTVGVDDVSNCTVKFSLVGTSPNRIKVTVTNDLTQTIRGGICIDVKGGGSNLAGRAGASLTML